MAITNDHGLLVDNTTTPPTAIGYLMDFAGHGTYSPTGKVGELGKHEIQEHNRLLAEMEWQGMVEHGAGILYLTSKTDERAGSKVVTWSIGNWTGSHKKTIPPPRRSFHNFAGPDGRRDVWFSLAGWVWHGVNVGWGQVCRVRRTKTKSESTQEW